MSKNIWMMLVTSTAGMASTAHAAVGAVPGPAAHWLTRPSDSLVFAVAGGILLTIAAVRRRGAS
jgi:hypothetical protein